MISYSWADQEQVKLIRDKLVMQGYKVWMDIGSISKYTTSSPTHMTRKSILTASLYIADNGFTCMGATHVYNLCKHAWPEVFKIDFHCFDEKKKKKKKTRNQEFGNQILSKSNT